MLKRRLTLILFTVLFFGMKGKSEDLARVCADMHEDGYGRKLGKNSNKICVICHADLLNDYVNMVFLRSDFLNLPLSP